MPVSSSISSLLEYTIGQHRPRIVYAYPPSPTSSGRNSPDPAHHLHSRSGASTVRDRLERLKADLAALESEVADSKEAENAEGTEEPGAGELISEVADVKSRLEKIGKIKGAVNKTGREKLVDAVVQDDAERERKAVKKAMDKAAAGGNEEEKKSNFEMKDVAEMDRRLGELEKAVGASSAIVDDVSSPIAFHKLGKLTP